MIFDRIHSIVFQMSLEEDRDVPERADPSRLFASAALNYAQPFVTLHHRGLLFPRYQDLK